MTILITGSKGQLGNELISMLKSGRAEIGEIPKDLKDARVIAVDIDELDISDVYQVDKFIDEKEIDVIINCAAMTNVDGCETMKEVAFKANVMGPRNLARAAQRIGAKFIHVSTDYVFAGDGKEPYCEWDKKNPKSVYGKSKSLGEDYALSFCERTFIVRTSWLYGYVGKNFVKTVRRVMREKGAMTVVNDQRGNPTNANDLAYHLLKLAVCDEYGIYHCTGKGECTWYDFACAIAKHSALKGTISPCNSDQYPSPVKRPAYSSLSHLALECTVGDEMRDWEEALIEYLTKVED